MDIETLKKTVAYEVYKQNKKDSIFLQLLIVISILVIISYAFSTILSAGLHVVILAVSAVLYKQKRQIIDYLKQKYNFS